MPSPAILVAIPTLHGGPLLDACLAALDRQTERDFEVVVIDNGQAGVAEAPGRRVLRNTVNVGFGSAVNQAWATTTARYLATLNDDAEPHPGWLAALRGAMEASHDIGMCASQVRLFGTGTLDSAGMLVYGDGSSKQRGHGDDPARWSTRRAALCPSASAALYRREMLEDVGLFDHEFFLYCEDTDLGLRARWNGWDCVYVPDAVVDHRYSQSAGAASALKAWYIERNRLWVAAKNYPVSTFWAMPFYGLWRYGWHLWYLLRGRGTAARFRSGGETMGTLLSILLRSHWSLVTNFGALRRKRRAIQQAALITPRQFRKLMREHAISGREIARL